MSFDNLSVAESFLSDNVLNLGSYSGPAVDLPSGSISSPTEAAVSASILQSATPQASLRFRSPRLGR